MTKIASVLAKFGNVRAAARAIGRAPSVIQYWRRTGRIPAQAQASVLEAAQRASIDITAADLISPPPFLAPPPRHRRTAPREVAA